MSRFELPSPALSDTPHCAKAGAQVVEAQCNHLAPGSAHPVNSTFGRQQTAMAKLARTPLVARLDSGCNGDDDSDDDDDDGNHPRRNAGRKNANSVARKAFSVVCCRFYRKYCHSGVC
ncbi:hypothetical protein [Paraburkholderia tropica]|uniref:hypothetical protein n=1 Tax=Paraburkholderia tropica TaxID=92647 RepID=UPI000F5583C0|nr:hypothetical protein [Paraburkholderia tropica]RQN39382.1 hypothetical protein EHZ25_09015 [Paraburkholderia tropica]